MNNELIGLTQMYINALLDNDSVTASVLARFIDIELEETVPHSKVV